MGSIFPVYLSVSSVIRTIVDNIRRGLRLFLHYARIVGAYIYRFLRLAYRTLQRFYAQFQKDPFTTVQFAGTLAILINNAVL